MATELRPPAQGAPAGGSTPIRPTAMVLTGIVSVQCGAAVATRLFDDVGPLGTVTLRIGAAAALLLVLWRPQARELGRGELRLVLAFGIALAGMNLAFYAALDRIPLGVTVALEMVGPLSVAVAGSRRRLDLLWVALAAVGVVLLCADRSSGGADTVGVLLALAAGACWAAYILLAARTGASMAGGSGLAMAMAVAFALVLAPGVLDGGADLLRPEVVAVGAAVGVLSSVVPYSLELEALRSLSTATFGILMSLEPAMAALAGLAIAGQNLSGLDLAAIALVITASGGALRRGGPAPVDGG